MKLLACDACGLDTCPYACEEEPCWGQIQPIERKQWQGDGYNEELYLHACDGHKMDGMYVEPPEEDL